MTSKRIVKEDTSDEVLIVNPRYRRVRVALSPRIQKKFFEVYGILDDVFGESDAPNPLRDYRNYILEEIERTEKINEGRKRYPRINQFEKEVPVTEKVKKLFERCVLERILSQDELRYPLKDDKTCMIDVNKVVGRYVNEHKLKDPSNKLIRLDDFLVDLLGNDYNNFFLDVGSETFKHNRIGTLSKYLLR